MSRPSSPLFSYWIDIFDDPIRNPGARPPSSPTKVFRHSTRHTSNYFFLPLHKQLCRYHDYDVLFILLLAIHISNAPPPSVQFREGEFATPSPAFVALNISDPHPSLNYQISPILLEGEEKKREKKKKSIQGTDLSDT